MDINLWLILFQTIPFLVVMFLLNKIIFRPALTYLAERERNITGFEREARLLMDEAEEKEGELELRLDEVRTKAGTERVQLLAETREQEEVLLKAAREEAEALITRESTAIEDEEQRALAGLEGDSKSLAEDIASQVLGRKLGLLLAFGLGSLLLTEPALAAGGGDGNPLKWVAFHFVNFLIFATILYLVIRRPLADHLANRRAQITDDLARAKELSEQAQERSKEVELRIEGMASEERTLIDKVRRGAETERSGRIKQAERAAEAIKEAAERVVNEEKVRARHRVRVAVANQALDQAKDRIKSELGEADESRLWRESLNQLEEGQA